MAATKRCAGHAGGMVSDESAMKSARTEFIHRPFGASFPPRTGNI
jgi:hypothetical protein